MKKVPMKQVFMRQVLMRQVLMRQGMRGFSLIELMISMVLGIAMVGGMIVVFAGNQRSSDLSVATAQLQANARFAVEEISRDLRAAGYRGCSSNAATLSSSTPLIDADLLSTLSITGAQIGTSSWTPSMPAGYTPPTDNGKPLAGTDALIVRYGVAPGHQLSKSMASESATILLKDKTEQFEKDDLLVVSDCQGAEIFQINAITGADSEPAIQPTQALTRAYRLAEGFERSVRVMPLVDALYYVGNTNRTNEVGDPMYSLYLQTFPYDLDKNPPLELVEGVEQMQLQFGIRSVSGNTQFVSPDNASFDPERITSVRIGLLLTSVDPIMDRIDSRSFRLANTLVEAEGTSVDAPSYPASRRLHVPYNTTITIRNRNLDGAAS